MHIKEDIKIMLVSYYRNKSKNSDKLYNSTKGKYIQGVEGLDPEKTYFVNFSKYDKQPEQEGRHCVTAKKVFVKDNSVLLYGISVY